MQLGSRQTVSIHPSSVLFQSKPAAVVFTELVQTGKRYVRQVDLLPSYQSKLNQTEIIRD